MDIDLLSKMVKDLILRSDSVALPGVGTFVAELVPATFSDRGFAINPPYRRLSFRQKADAQDPALARLYAVSNGVAQDEAGRIVTEFLQGMKEVLIKNKVIIFPGLGRLRATKENAFFFIADEDLDIYPEGFGLEALSLKTAVVGQKPEGREGPSVPATDPRIPSVPATAAPGPSVPASDEAAPPPALLAPTRETSASAPGKNYAGRMLLKTFLWILAAAAAFLGLLAILGRLAPDVVDRFLYSAEELRILNS